MPAAQPEAEGTRERILDIALELFVEQGYENTSLREIAERLGFTKAAIYYHFASKDDILMALHLRIHDLGWASIEALAGDNRPSAWAPTLRGMVEVMLANRNLILLHQRNLAALEKLHDKGHAASHEDLEARFRAALEDPAANPRDRVRLVSALGAMVGSLTYLGEVKEDEVALYGDLLREVVTDLLGD